MSSRPRPNQRSVPKRRQASSGEVSRKIAQRTRGVGRQLRTGLATASRETMGVFRKSARVLAPVVAVACLFFGLFWGAALAVDHVHESEAFEASRLEFTPSEHVDAARLRALLGVQDGTNIFELDVQQLQDAVQSDPWIKEARVVRVLPNTLRVDFTEYIARAVVLDRGPWLVDAQGTKFKRADPDELAELPLVTGVETSLAVSNDVDFSQIRRALEALDRYEAQPERPRVSELHFGEAGDIDIYVQGVSTRLHFARSEFELGLRRFDALRTVAAEHFRPDHDGGDPWSVVYLDAPPSHDDLERVIVRTAPQARAEVTAASQNANAGAG